MSRTTLGLSIASLLVALLACGGSSDECSANITLDGKTASKKAEDRLAARHEACRAWCKANDSQSSDRDMLNACASRCDAKLMFGEGSEQIACK